MESAKGDLNRFARVEQAPGLADGLGDRQFPFDGGKNQAGRDLKLCPCAARGCRARANTGTGPRIRPKICLAERGSNDSAITDQKPDSRMNPAPLCRPPDEQASGRLPPWPSVWCGYVARVRTSDWVNNFVSSAGTARGWRAVRKEQDTGK